MTIDFNKTLETINFDELDLPLQLQEPFRLLLNKIEEQTTLIKTLQAEHQQLLHERNRLKREKGKPNFRA